MTTEREVQACVEDSVGMIESAIENALQVNCLEGDVTVDIDSWNTKGMGTMQYPIECQDRRR